jgi:hypothetical protein
MIWRDSVRVFGGLAKMELINVGAWGYRLSVGVCLRREWGLWFRRYLPGCYSVGLGPLDADVFLGKTSYTRVRLVPARRRGPGA